MRKINSLTGSYFLYFLILVGLVLFRIISALGVFSIFGETADYIFTFVVQVLILFGLAVFGFSFLTKKSKKDVLEGYKFKKISKKAVFISVLIGIVVYFLNSYIASFFVFILSLFGFSSSSVVSIPTVYPVWLLLINIIFTAVLPAFCEETVHRGMLLSEIKKKNVVKAIIISSLLFGLLHINIYQFFYATILGALLAVITLASNSIYPAMIIHFMNNAINVYMVFSSVNNLFSIKLVNSIFAMANANTIFGVLFLVLFFMFLLFALNFLYQQLCKESVKNQVARLQEGLGRFLARKIYFDELSDVKNNLPLRIEREVDFSVISDYIKHSTQNREKTDTTKSDNFSKIFLYGSLFLSVVTTIFTFIWGII